MSLRIAIGQFKELTDEKLRFAKQIGVGGIQMNNPTLPGESRWEEQDVRALVEKTESYGLKFEAIENVPVHFYNKVMLGLPGRDEQVENYNATIRAVGRAGIPILGHHFMPNSVWRTDRSAPGRGDSGNTEFNMAVVERTKTIPEMMEFVPKGLGHLSAMPMHLQGEVVVDEATM